jgi:hypothetical protein
MGGIPLSGPETPIEIQVLLLVQLLDYCDINILEMDCGDSDEAEAVGSAAVAPYANRLRYQVIGPNLRITDMHR